MGRVGVIAPYTSYPSVARRLNGILQAVGRRTLEIVLFDQESAAESSSPLLATLPITGRLDGLIVVSLPLDETVAKRLIGLRLPTVLVDVRHPRFDSVLADDITGGRLDSLQPFCRIASHTSEEVRDILATLEQIYQPLLPQLNLRRWTGSIYDWLTQSALDPANSGRVTMDNLMKLVLAALQWSYEAKAPDVQVEWLERAAELLVLRHDTLRIIDGAGPGIEADQASAASAEQANETQTEQVSSSNEEQKLSSSVPTEQATVAGSRLLSSHPKSGEHSAVSESNQSAKCMFFGVVPIDIKRFEESDVALVECPGCGRVWTLSPRSGVLRGLRRTTNAKRILPIPDDGGPGEKGKQTGM